MVGWPVCGLIGPQQLGDCLGGGLALVDWPGLSVVSVVSVCPRPGGLLGLARLRGAIGGVCSDWGGLVGPG